MVIDESSNTNVQLLIGIIVSNQYCIHRNVLTSNSITRTEIIKLDDAMNVLWMELYQKQN